MLRMVRAGMVLAALAMCWGQIVGAQQAEELAQAPLPTQILAARKVFLSNGPAEGLAGRGVADAAYNLFYAGMKSWGAYELVGAPADADLVLELRYALIQGSGGTRERFRLVILDPKTHVVLWSLSEEIERANLVSTARKNFARAMSDLVDDVKKLGGPLVVPGGGIKK